MNSNILRAIESLCDDIATDRNIENNQKRANAILTLAFGGIFTPKARVKIAFARPRKSRRITPRTTPQRERKKIKSNSRNLASNSSITALSLPLSERSRAAYLLLFRNCSRTKCRSTKAIKTTGAPPRSVNTLTENTSNNSTAATSSRLYRT